MCRYTLFVLTVILAASVSAKLFTEKLEPFSSIRVCVPYTIQVSVSDSKNPYVVELDVDQDVYDAFTAEVSLGELTLTSIGDFDTGNPIKVTVKLPADKLAMVHAQGFGSIYISGAFTGSDLQVISGGTKAVYADKLLVDGKLNVENAGVGDVTLGKSLKGEISVTQTGISKVYLLGVSGKVDVNLGGISTLGIESADDSTVIDGSVFGLADIYYTGGTCNLPSGFFKSACQKVSQFDIDRRSTTFQWTCGVQVKGNSVCGANSASSQTFSDGQGQSFVSSSAVSTGGSSSVSSSSSNGVTHVSVGGDNANAVAINNKNCEVPEQELFIIPA
eukprot:TRINITY_DN3568_c0_g1_i1.p2 TRINITY_DN3568_c0_g1~~TRINITY_DN3568_c0_g1_i1.p2  ORF type:complete len:332 (-),score=63.45 TRINITY_DN3568_c0_g1_i1:1806-2801(-)